MEFVHTHIHSTFSVLDGIIRIPDLCKRVKELGMSACALTDHGVLYGSLQFYKEAKKIGIKPIIGVEAYITYDEDGLENKDKTRDNFHLILLVKNNVGLSNLFYLISNANINNFYYKPRISLSNLKKYSEGLIASSACLGGWIAGHGIFNEEKKSFEPIEDKPQEAINTMREIFGKDFYLEVQDNDMWEQRAYNLWLIDIQKKQGLPIILTTDAHYLKATDYKTHRLIMAQQLKKTLLEYENDSKMKYGDSFYIKSSKEMKQAALMLEIPDAIENTVKIADNCNIDITIGKYQSPTFDIKQANDYEEFLKWRQKDG